MFHMHALAPVLTISHRIAFVLVFASTLGAEAPQNPSFNRDVLPILQNRCQECHRPGEIAPMPFVTYKQTRPWAKAIREAVLLRKMPPWFAEPGCGPFGNDRSLTGQEIDALVKWADAGAPEGSVKDRPPTRQWTEGWNIANPDAVFAMPHAFALPPSGDVEYSTLSFQPDLPKTSGCVMPSSDRVTGPLCIMRWSISANADRRGCGARRQACRLSRLDSRHEGAC